MIYPKDQILFSVTPSDDLAIEEAKEYIREKRLTSGNAKIVKRLDDHGVESLLVILKEDAEI